MHEHDFNFERYKNLDISNARPARLNPKIKQLQDSLRAMKSQDDFINFFDSDVREVIIKHSTPQDRVRLNAVIRALFD